MELQSEPIMTACLKTPSAIPTGVYRLLILGSQLGFACLLCRLVFLPFLAISYLCRSIHSPADVTWLKQFLLRARLYQAVQLAHLPDRHHD